MTVEDMKARYIFQTYFVDLERYRKGWRTDYVLLDDVDVVIPFRHLSYEMGCEDLMAHKEELARRTDQMQKAVEMANRLGLDGEGFRKFEQIRHDCMTQMNKAEKWDFERRQKQKEKK